MEEQTMEKEQTKAGNPKSPKDKFKIICISSLSICFAIIIGVVSICIVAICKTSNSADDTVAVFETQNKTTKSDSDAVSSIEETAENSSVVSSTEDIAENSSTVSSTDDIAENSSQNDRAVNVDMKTRVGSPNDCQRLKDLGGFSFGVNSANGVKVLWGGKNNSGKTINYYTVTLSFYDAVGGKLNSEITGLSTKRCKVVGPVAPGGDLMLLSLVDYVSACSEVQVVEIALEYSDGTKERGQYGWSTTYRNRSLDK